MNAIEIKNANMGYYQNIVLKNISLSIKEREMVLLMGENGAGKTTLIRSILGLLSLQAGSISFFEMDIKKYQKSEFIGYLPQKRPGEYLGLSVWDIVSQPFYAKKKFLEKLTFAEKDAISKIVTLVEMEKYLHHPFYQLSGGQQQRALLARALVANPKFLFLDEPLTQLDMKARENFILILQKVKKEKDFTCITITHYAKELASIFDRFIMIDHKIIYDRNTYL